MPTAVTLRQLDDLIHEGSSNNEIIIGTKLNTELHIIAKADCTIIALPFGNKIDLIDGQIIIHEK